MKNVSANARAQMWWYRQCNEIYIHVPSKKGEKGPPLCRQKGCNSIHSNIAYLSLNARNVITPLGRGIFYCTSNLHICLQDCVDETLIGIWPLIRKPSMRSAFFELLTTYESSEEHQSSSLQSQLLRMYVQQGICRMGNGYTSVYKALLR